MVKKSILRKTDRSKDFIKAIYKIQERPSFVLQGGQALHLIYGSPRYSVDVDFVFQGEIQSIERIIYKAVELLQKQFQHEDIRVNPATTEHPNLQDHKSFIQTSLVNYLPENILKTINEDELVKSFEELYYE